MYSYENIVKSTFRRVPFSCFLCGTKSQNTKVVYFFVLYEIRPSSVSESEVDEENFEKSHKTHFFAHIPEVFLRREEVSGPGPATIFCVISDGLSNEPRPGSLAKCVPEKNTKYQYFAHNSGTKIEFHAVHTLKYVLLKYLRLVK